MESIVSRGLSATATNFLLNAPFLGSLPRTSSFGVDTIGRVKKGKGSPHSITERRVPELISVLGSQPADDVSHKPGGRLPLLSARPAVIPATLKRDATNFAAR